MKKLIMLAFVCASILTFASCASSTTTQAPKTDSTVAHVDTAKTDTASHHITDTANHK